MNEQDLPPLDDDIQSLLGRARGLEAAPLEARTRVLAGVEALVLGPLASGGGHSLRSPAPATTSLGALRRAWPLLASFVVGGGAGAALLHATVKPPAAVVVPGPERVVYVDRPVPSAVEVPAAPAAAPSSMTAHAAESGPPVEAQGGLAAERALLDTARAALERQDGAAALAATREHERRFPGGQLVQEREAMAVRALVLLGRVPEARARTERFRARFPGSVLLPVLEAQVGREPRE